MLPRSGLSEVTGIVVVTTFKNIVKLRSIVTPGKACGFLKLPEDSRNNGKKKFFPNSYWRALDLVSPPPPHSKSIFKTSLKFHFLFPERYNDDRTAVSFRMNL